jgi:hypothetical protein
MTPDEYRAMCDEIGVSPYRFAEMCGAKPGSRPSWARDGFKSMSVPVAVATAIRVVYAVGTDMNYSEIAAMLREEADVLKSATATE